MKTPASKLVKITQKTANSGLSKGQKLFKKLIKKIDAQRATIGAWQAMIPLYEKKYTEEYSPLLATFNEHRSKMVVLFDRAHENKLINKVERTKLAELIIGFASEILADSDSPEIKAIYGKYNGVDFDAEDEEFDAEMKTMLEDLFGMEMPDDVDVNDPDSFLHMMEQHAQKMENEENAEPPQAKRKKSAKQIANEAKLEQEEKNIGLSIREVFRKLASTLHPDREQDPAERKRKTDLMQRVNVAYGNKDLLQLLELQLEIEQIDESMINNISEDRLRHYNKILAEQADELEMEIEHNLLDFLMRFQLDPETGDDPAEAMSALEYDIDELHEMTADLVSDFELFQDLKNLKNWLKHFRTPTPKSKQSAFDEMDFNFDPDDDWKRR